MSESKTTSDSGSTIYTNSALIADYFRKAANRVDYEVDKDGNVHLDLSGASEMVIDLAKSKYYNLAGAVVDEVDDADNDSLVVIDDFDSEYNYESGFEEVSLNEIGTEHKGKVVRVKAQIQDTGKPTAHNLTADWECQNHHITSKAYYRWVESLESPVVCDTADCGDRPTSRVPNAGCQINVQQMVLTEPDKDDRNSRNLIGELDEPHIATLDRRETVELLARVDIADKQRESKVEPYLHILGHKSVGHEVDLTDERIRELEQIVDDSDNIIDDLVESVAPQIVDRCGQSEAKLAGLLSVVKGSGSTDRDMTHALLYGQKGTGKSKIMEFLNDIAQNSQYADAQTASAAGLAATATQTGKLQGEGEQWVITSGTIPQAHDSVAFVDELDKADERIQEVLATPMASGMVIIKKAGEAELKANTSIVATANPEEHDYNGQEPIESLNVPEHIQDRFDAIIRVDDLIRERDKEREVMKKIARREKGDYNVPISKNDLKDYVALAKRLDVDITDDAQDEIIDRVLELRLDFKNNNLSTLSLSGREQAKLTRLSCAMAKLRLADKVREKDVKRAWNLMLYGLQSVTKDSLNLVSANTSTSVGDGK